MQRDIKEKSKWAWARFGDFNNFTALLELLGWKTAGVSVLGSMTAYAWLWEPGNRPITVLIGLVAALVVAVLSILWQVSQRARQGEPDKQTIELASIKSHDLIPNDLKIVIADARGHRAEYQTQTGHAAIITAATPSSVFRQQVALHGKTIEFIELPNGGPKDDGLDFFATIDDLRSRHPLQETFKVGNEIHACFLSGEGVFTESSEYIKRVKRLMLPLPNDHNIARLRMINSAIDYKSQIMIYANKAREQDKNSLRFYGDFLGTSLLFCNPLQRNAWVQIGIILPGTEARERPHWRIYKSHHESAFLSLYGTFNRLWDISPMQTEEEDFQEGFDSARQ